ncbi:MAG: hypothetical protein R3B60_04490 [Candidatus Paceibacterota bacterium]
MFVIEVIPLIKGTKLDTLSYFSSTDYPIGTFIKVPIRGKEHRAIVTNSKSASDSKTSLKGAGFALRKLPTQADTTTIPDCLRKTANELTKIYPSSVGGILYQILPPEVKDGQYNYPTVSTLTHEEDSTPQVITARIEERYVAYRTHIRSTLAKRGSVMFVVPNSIDLEYAEKHLSHGIEDRIVKFSPYQNKTERKAAYKAFEDTSLAKVIITTPSHTYLDRVDLLSIIVEQSASHLYKNRTRPYLDHRTAIIKHAKVTGRSLLMGDILPRAEDEHRRRFEFYTTHSQETKRIAFPTPFTIIEQKDKSTPNTPFALFSPELKRRMNSTLEARGRVFLYGARRGIAPVVNCVDCNYIFRCPDSHTPYSLLRTYNKEGDEQRWFVSSTSGRRVRAADTCDSCGSWRLKQRGIGIQHVYDECKEIFPNHKVILFDGQTASTRQKAKKIIGDFYDNKGVILVGTQMTLPYLTIKGINLSAVISMDATRTIPTWRADEDTFRLLLQLRDISHKEVLVQTRSKPDDLLRYAKQGQLDSFYHDELALRESLNYPSFSTFFLLSWSGNKNVVKETEDLIKKVTQKYDGHFYNNPLSSENKILRYALFRLSGDREKITNFVELLKSLPPYIKIEVDPNRIV